MPSKIYVIAGNHHQYTDFVKRKLTEEFDHCMAFGKIFNRSMSDFVYVNGPEQLIGVADPQGFFIGTWRHHPKIEPIMVRLMIAKVPKNTLLEELYESVRR